MKKPMDIYKLFNLNRRILKKASKIQNGLREDFEHFERNDKYIGMMSFAHYPLLIETASYYNGELLSAYSLFKVLNAEGVDYRLKAFHFENLLFRIISFWEYTYQFINHYLHLELVDFHAKNAIIERSYYEPKFVPHESGKKVIWEELPDDVKKKNKKDLNRNLRMINKSNIIMHIECMYEVKGNMLKLLRLINNNNLEYIKEIRNQVVHQRSAGASFTVNFDAMFCNYSISINNNGWVDFEEAEREIDQCMKIIHTLIKTIHEIILKNEYPNRIENAGKKFAICKIVCNNCNHTYLYPSLLLGDEEKFLGVIICPECKQLGGKVVKEIESTEIDHNNVWGEYVKSFEDKSNMEE